MIFSNLVFAAPGIPHAFYGTVTWNGSPAPDKTIVVAKMNGAEVARTATSGGKYGYNPAFFIADPYNNNLGKPINFFVNDVDTGQTSYFCNWSGGDSCLTLLNLAASGGSSPPPSSSPPSTGPTGGPVGSYVPPTTNQTTTQGCQERWTCSDWSACQGGTQTRTCNDVNNCGSRNNEPLTAQPCSVEEIEESKTATIPAGITGFFLGMEISNWIVGIVIGIVIAVFIIFFFRRKPKGKK